MFERACAKVAVAVVASRLLAHVAVRGLNEAFRRRLVRLGLGTRLYEHASQLAREGTHIAE